MQRRNKIFFIIALVVISLFPGIAAHADTFMFLKNLGRGASGEDVRKLQEILRNEPIGGRDIYPEGLATGYFGPATERAVKRFQAKYGIEQTGSVGPKTRVKLNSVKSPIVSMSTTSPQQLTICQTPVFTKPLVAPDRVSNISPLGTPNRPNRSYISLDIKPGDEINRVSLYAPAEIRLVGANWYIHPLLKRSMWALSFDAGCGVTFLLGHVIDVVDKIKAIGPLTPGSSSAQSQLQTAIPFTAGELIGSVVIVRAPKEALQLAAPEMLGFDFVASNVKVTNQFANQARYALLNHEPDSLHAVCPYDLFSPELRNAYAAKYGGTQGPFFGATCGYVSHDVVGTISGQWFKNQDPVSGVSSGDNLGVNFTSFVEGVNGYTRLLVDEGLNDTIHTYSNNPTYINPSEVRDSHCYQNDNASYYVYAKLASPDIINISSGQGSCPERFPNSGYKTFYR